MYRRFAFEGEIHASLECVPLTIRRKLDLAGYKISLAGWQELGREERLCLCHLPVDGPEDLAVYREVMAGFCARRGVPLTPLAVDPAGWNTPTVPAGLRERAGEAPLDDAVWAGLDEETRYALVKLADPKRTPEKLRAALGELGLLPRSATDVSACDGSS